MFTPMILLVASHFAPLQQLMTALGNHVISLLSARLRR